MTDYVVANNYFEIQLSCIPTDCFAPVDYIPGFVVFVPYTG